MGFDSLGKSISSVVEERLSSPLVSSFVLSWCLYNYKFFVILFSKNTVSETFALTSQRFPDAWAILVHGVFWPSFFAALYLFVLPYPSQWVFRKWKVHQKKMDDIRYESESQQRLTVEESRTIRGVVRQREAEIDALVSEIEKLKADLKQADRRASDALERAAISRVGDSSEQALNRNDATKIFARNHVDAKEIGELANDGLLADASNAGKEAEEEATSDSHKETSNRPLLDISDDARAKELAVEQLRILEFVGNTPNCGSFYIAAEIHLPRVEADFYIEDLVERGYLELRRDMDGDEGYVINQMGRKVWMASKNIAQ